MPTGGTGRWALYGRDREVLDLLGMQVAVAVISGDSGVGKTRVLEEVVAQFDGVASAPMAVGHAPAALQAALLDALGAVAAQIADDEGAARRVAKLLLEGGRRLANVKATEIGLAVARIVLGVVRDRVGKNVTDVIVEYFDQVRDAAADDVVARIRQAGDPDVIHAVAELAADVAAAAGGRRILLALDNVDHLQADDRGRLMDLGPILRGGVSVLCTFTSVSGADESTLDEYIRAGVTVYPILGLQEWAVEQWLVAEGLPSGFSGEVLLTTNGYGLAVASAVELLKAGKGLVGSPVQHGREEVLRAATRQALRGLDPDSQAAALKLSILRAPLPPEHAAAYLGLEPAAWAVTEGLLVDSHIFVPGNPPWFHDQRRRLLREQVPGSAVPRFLQAAGKELRAIAETSAEVPADVLTQYAEICDAQVALGVAEPAVAAVSHLSGSGLAVLGAIIELTDGESPGLDGEQALLHAQAVFRYSGDLTGALSELGRAKLIATASNEYQTFVAASLGSPDALLYANGKIGSRLGRIPVHRIASLVFNGRLRGVLGPFVAAVYGVGEPSIGELSRSSVRSRGRPPLAQPPLARHRQPLLFLQGRFGEVPFYAAAAYQEQSDRDSALSALSAQSTEPLLGQQVMLNSVMAQPDSRLPPRRLTSAFERAFGFSIGNIINSFDPVIQGDIVSRQDAVEQQLVALNLLAVLSNERERQVTGDKASRYGLLRWVDPDGQGEMTAVVANASGIIELGEVSPDVLRGFDRIALAQLAGLAPDQRIGHAQYRIGPQSDVRDLQLAVNEVARHSRKIVAYNEQQPRRQLPTDVGHLQALLQAQLDDQEAMARRIADSFRRPLPTGHDIYLLVDPNLRQPGMIPWAGQDAILVRANMRGTSPRVMIAIEPAERPTHVQDWQDSIATQVQKIFGVADVSPTIGESSSALDALAKLLGHMFNDIMLT